MTNSRLQKVPSDVKDRLDRLSNELTGIEGKKVFNTDVLRRVFSSNEIIERLKIGSMERRYGKK